MQRKRMALHQCSSEQELVKKGQQALQDFELGALLVTRGEHGMTLIRADEQELHLPARAREVFDVTGAGDTVISVLASAVAAGESLPDAVRWAARCGASAATRWGAQASLPTREQVLELEI